jgi:hypothetical protein
VPDVSCLPDSTSSKTSDFLKDGLSASLTLRGRLHDAQIELNYPSAGSSVVRNISKAELKPSRYTMQAPRRRDILPHS